MPVKTSRSPLPWKLRKQLLDMQGNQLVKRQRAIDLNHEIGELRALSRLAFDLWGAKGFVWMYPETPGIKHLGYYLDGKPAKEPPTGRIVPGLGRPHTIVFSGATYADLHAQVQKARTSTVA